MGGNAFEGLDRLAKKDSQSASDVQSNLKEYWDKVGSDEDS